MRLWAVLPTLVACSTEVRADHDIATQVTVSAIPSRVGFDLRQLRPREGEPLAVMFERLRAQAVAEGKVTVVLFSAQWCQACRTLDLELGNLHAPEDIGHVRIFDLREEDWSAALRIHEFNNLRRRWHAPLGSYPLMVVLDAHGQAIEAMDAAVDRLTAAGAEPTLPRWLREFRSGATPNARRDR